MSVSLGGTSNLLDSFVDVSKTGLMVKDTGRRDSAGLEDMDAFFSPTVENQAKKTGLLSAAKVATKFQNTIQSTPPLDLLF
jgi:hypothetical protein